MGVLGSRDYLISSFYNIARFLKHRSSSAKKSITIVISIKVLNSAMAAMGKPAPRNVAKVGLSSTIHSLLLYIAERVALCTRLTCKVG